MTIEFNNLNSLSLLQRIGLQESDLTPEQKDKLKEGFNRILNLPNVKNILMSSGNGKIKFDFTIDEKEGFSINGRQIAQFSSLVKGNSPFRDVYKQIQALDQYAKRKGLGTRAIYQSGRQQKIEMNSRDEKIKRSLDALYVKPKFQEENGVLLDKLSISANSSAIVASIPGLPLVNVLSNIGTGLSLIRGPLATVQGGLIANVAWNKMAAAAKREDWAGVGHGASLGAVGLGYSGVGVTMTISGAATFAGKMTLAAATGIAGVAGAGFVMEAGLGIYGTYGWWITRKFRLELKEILKNPDEKKRILEAVAWLEENLSLTEWDVMRIRSGTKTDEEAAKKIEKEILKKWDRFERRTNAGCARMLRRDLPGLIEKLLNNETGAIQKANEIILEVEKANYKERVIYEIYILLAILGFLAFGLMFACPPLVIALLFALGAVVWLSVDSSDYKERVTEWAWRRYLQKNGRETAPGLSELHPDRKGAI